MPRFLAIDLGDKRTGLAVAASVLRLPMPLEVVQATTHDLVRDAVVKRRIVINGLAIDRPSMPDLPEYFRNSVTGGPGSFVLRVKDRRSFAEGILRKMIREIADRTPWETKRRTALSR